MFKLKRSSLTVLSALFLLTTSCNSGLIKTSDIGMSLDEFTSKVENYSVIEMGADYGIYAIGEGKNKRIVHFKNDTLVKVEKDK